MYPNVTVAKSAALALSIRSLRNLFLVATLAISMIMAATLYAGRADAQTANQSSRAKADATALLRLMNSERAANHLPTLRMNTRLVTSAGRHNLAMARSNTMSHQLPGEKFLGTRVSATGYKWRMAGENVAWNSDRTVNGVLYLERIMYNEHAPENGHRLNILSKSFRDVGIAVYFDNAHGKVWISQDFGQPA